MARSESTLRLTKRAIDAMHYRGAGNRRDVRWDADVRGFGVRVYPSGRRTFVLSYRVRGRKRMMTLGDFGVLTVQQARAMAREHLVAAGKGEDPLEERRKAARGETVRELCADYLERHAKPHKRSWAADARRIERHILPAWGALKVSALTRAEVAALHWRIGREHPIEANRVHSLVRKMLALAETWGYVPEGHPNAARGIERYRESKRERWVTPEEMPRLAAAIEAEENPYARAALWLYLLTGLRRSELLRARWEDVDLERAQIRIPETKAGRTYHVPLTAPALALLRALPRIEGNPFILPGAKPGEHLVNIDKPWRRVRARAGTEDVRLHDLRRTLGSWLAQAGNSLHLIGRVLNHSNSSTTEIYVRFAQDHVRAAMDAYAERLMGAAGKKTPADVVQLREARR